MCPDTLLQLKNPDHGEQPAAPQTSIEDVFHLTAVPLSTEEAAAAEGSSTSEPSAFCGGVHMKELTFQTVDNEGKKKFHGPKDDAEKLRKCFRLEGLGVYCNAMYDTLATNDNLTASFAGTTRFQKRACPRLMNNGVDR